MPPLKNPGFAAGVFPMRFGLCDAGGGWTFPCRLSIGERQEGRPDARIRARRASSSLENSEAYRLRIAAGLTSDADIGLTCLVGSNQVGTGARRCGPFYASDFFARLSRPVAMVKWLRATKASKVHRVQQDLPEPRFA